MSATVTSAYWLVVVEVVGARVVYAGENADAAVNASAKMVAVNFMMLLMMMMMMRKWLQLQ
jgi:hypothetical protein